MVVIVILRERLKFSSEESARNHAQLLLDHFVASLLQSIAHAIMIDSSSEGL